MNTSMNKEKNSRTMLIADPGSCHCGNFDLAQELVRVARECGVDMVKFQLFEHGGREHKAGNIPLDYNLFVDLVAYGEGIGIPVFASVFCSTAYKVVAKSCKAVKFSFGSPLATWIPQAVQDFCPDYVFASGDIMHPVPEIVQRLYCIPQYPVPFKIDFEQIFKRFDGFSDHTLGINQTLEAVRCGASIIEKHFRLDRADCDHVPDGKFSLRPKVMEKLATEMKYAY
jgi:N,N'-diacetyllegionaminate synthase